MLWLLQVSAGVAANYAAVRNGPCHPQYSVGHRPPLDRMFLCIDPKSRVVQREQDLLSATIRVHRCCEQAHLLNQLFTQQHVTRLNRARSHRGTV